MPSPELTQLLASEHPSGVFWLKTHASVAELQKHSRAKALTFFHLEGKKIEKKDQSQDLLPLLPSPFKDGVQ